MRKIYSLFSFVLISSIAIAQPQGNKKAVDHHELTKKEAVDKAKVVTGYTSLNQVLTAISKHVGRECYFFGTAFPYAKHG